MSDEEPGIFVRCMALDRISLALSLRHFVPFAAGECEACPRADCCPAKRIRDGSRVLRTTLRVVVLAR